MALSLFQIVSFYLFWPSLPAIQYCNRYNWLLQCMDTLHSKFSYLFIFEWSDEWTNINCWLVVDTISQESAVEGASSWQLIEVTADLDSSWQSGQSNSTGVLHVPVGDRISNGPLGEDQLLRGGLTARGRISLLPVGDRISNRPQGEDQLIRRGLAAQGRISWL